jgi:hypothetical protein
MAQVKRFPLAQAVGLWGCGANRGGAGGLKVASELCTSDDEDYEQYCDPHSFSFEGWSFVATFDSR